MATALDVIRRAMRLIGALAEGELPTGEQSDDALLSFQAMIGEWETRGLKLGAMVDTTFTASTVIPLPPTHLNALAFNLAVVLAPEYGAQSALPMLSPQAERAFDAQLSSYVRPVAVPIDPALTSQYGNLIWSDPYWWNTP
jgi:hypothetical protein